MPNYTDASVARFHSGYERGDLDACWLWTRSRTPSGYGQIAMGGRLVYAHRVSADLSGQSIVGRVVRHVCDNPPCVNPGHLLVGTQKQNSADMIARGRQGGTKLNPARVRDIRAAHTRGETMTAIANRHGVSRRAIGLVLKGETWSHVV